MGQKYKYDIAISVAEENVEVAEKIATALKKRGIDYYLYTEQEDNNWGQYIFDIILQAFGPDARYVLMITSNVFYKKHWLNIEAMIINAFKKNTKPNILQLCMDDTEIWLTKHIAHKKWKENPEEIANAIWKKLNPPPPPPSGIVRPVVLWCISIVIAVIVGSVFVMRYNKTNSTPDYSRFGFTQDQNNNSASKSAAFNAKPIPAGSFSMGIDNETNVNGPSHKITLKNFFISPTEVTVPQFEAYCKATRKSMPQQPAHRFQPNCPVVNVTWHEAAAYCEWAGGRLPTEAEWEYAAAGGATGDKYSGGNNAKNVASYNQPKHSQVALRDSNSYGLFDMTGNVAEWCSDWHNPDYYSISETENPKGPRDGTEKVVRGGSFINYANELNIRYRNKEHPDSARAYIGFRVVWDK
jgi:formylglycine-generating enzyme